MTAELPSADVAPQNGTKRHARRVIGYALFIVAAVYLFNFIATQWESVSVELSRFQPTTLLFGFASVIAMLALKAAYHVLTIRRMGYVDAPSCTRIMSVYSASQLVRYLPGKVFGVVYEADQLAGNVSFQHVAAANIIQGMMTMALTVAILATIAAWHFNVQMTGTFFIAAASATGLWAAHYFHLTERALTYAARAIPRLRTLPAFKKTHRHASLLASVVLLIEWIPYFALWSILLPPGQEGLGSAILLGACYAGASLVASFAVIMPSGLVIREAIFLWAGNQLSIDPASLILMGLLSRVIFTLSDVLFASICFLAERIVRAASLS